MQNVTKTATRLQTLQRKEFNFKKDFGRFMREQKGRVLQIVQDGTLYRCIFQSEDAKNAYALGRTPARSFYNMVSRFNLKFPNHGSN